MRGKYKTKFSGKNFKKLKKYIKKLNNGKSTTHGQKRIRTADR